MIAVPFEDTASFIEILSNKLMQSINQDVDYLHIIIGVLNGGNDVVVGELHNVLETHLRGVVAMLDQEEANILPNEESLKGIEFYEQEKIRNIIRLRFSIQKILGESYKTKSELKLLNYQRFKKIIKLNFNS